MTQEQLLAAYETGFAAWFVDDWIEEDALTANSFAHAAGLAEVARQQAERDIEIAKSLVPLVVPLTARSETKRQIAHAIRAQFEEATHE